MSKHNHSHQTTATTDNTQTKADRKEPSIYDLPAGSASHLKGKASEFEQMGMPRPDADLAALVQNETGNGDAMTMIEVAALQANDPEAEAELARVAQIAVDGVPQGKSSEQVTARSAI